MELDYLTFVYGPALIGLATAVLLGHLLSVVYRDCPTGAQEWEFEKRRQMRMRDESALFRWFEPFILELARAVETPAAGSLLEPFKVRRSIDQSLDRLGTSVPFRWHEYLGLSLFQGIIAAVFAGAFLWSSVPPATLLAIVTGLAWLACWAQLSELKGKAKRRLAEFARRLPFSVDLMALTMDAGATFMESLETTVKENADNPTGEEFGELQRKVLSGQTLVSALEDMRVRMADPAVDEIVFSIINSEKLGTPKAKTLLGLANQMRLRRSQAVEKAIGQSQTMMTFPGFIIMLACLLIVAAPFGLAAYQQNVL